MNHVGRPTNEEIKKRSRKKMIKILLPTFVLMVALIIMNEHKAILGLMGNSIDDCTEKCSSGWELVEGICTLKEESEAEKTDAILVGDINGDSSVNIDDYTAIKKNINSNKKLTEKEQIVYDLNQDGIINDEDISIDYFSSVSGQTVISKQYSCLKDSDEHTVDENGYEVDKTITYELKGSYCYAKITKTKKIIPKKVCKLDNEKKETIYHSTQNYNPKKGDIVFFSDNQGYTVNQIGIVVGTKKNSLITIEGNVGCKYQGKEEACSKTNDCDCQNQDYRIRHSIVGKRKYKNYQNNSKIIGYISLSKITSKQRINHMINLAKKQLNNGGSDYWNEVKAWQGSSNINWSSLFVAWNLEQSHINPKNLGWSIGSTTWLRQAKQLTK